MRQANREEQKESLFRKKISKQSRNRLTFVITIASLFFAFLIIGVGYRTIAQGDDLAKKAYAMQSRDRDITPRRGTIYDRNGKPLAISATVYMVSINPASIRNNNTRGPDLIASDLSRLLSVDKKLVLERIKKNTFYELIKRKVENKDRLIIVEWKKNYKIDGVEISEDSKRYYPNQNFASHLLGFTGYDNQGLNGLEIMFDNYLKGSKGKISTGLDRDNRVLPYGEEKRVDSTDGYDVHLTIDETIQYFAEKALDQAVRDNKVKNGAVAIVTDPKTGDILAMVSKPDFNPNDPYAAPNIPDIDVSKWKGNQSSADVKTLNETVWRNKAIADSYEPGSTFKAFTVAAGLEEGVVTPETMVTDAPISIFGSTINCWKRPIHGAETLRKAVYNSCNPVFSNIALKLGITKFYEYFKAFGFYAKTGITLPGEGMNQTHTNPTIQNMAISAFGQRHTVTPIQLIMAYGAVANGGTLMEPRIATEISDKNGNVIKTFEPQMVRRVISQQTSDTLRDILTGVVEEGTGSRAYVAGYNIAGKTGTSETTDKSRYIASFSGFAPSDNPKICVLVILDNPQGSSHMGGVIAAPVASKIFEDTLNYLEVERKYSDKDVSKIGTMIAVPNLVGKTLGEAKAILARKEYGLKYKTIGDNSDSKTIITDQEPQPGMKISQRSKMQLYLKSGSNTH